MMQQPGNLSGAEKLAVGELLRHENLCAKKYALYMNQSKDPHIRSVLNQMQDIKMRHISTLNNMLHSDMPGTGTPATGNIPTT